MSTCSNGSQISVSYFGEEMNFDTMLDNCFTQMQTYLNDLHCQVRELSMVDEQDSDYLVALDLYHSIVDNIDGLAELMSELKSVSKQVLGPCPKESKLKVKAKTDLWKQKKIEQKNKTKLEKMANLEIKE